MNIQNSLPDYRHLSTAFSTLPSRYCKPAPAAIFSQQQRDPSGLLLQAIAQCEPLLRTVTDDSSMIIGISNLQAVNLWHSAHPDPHKLLDRTASDLIAWFIQHSEAAIQLALSQQQSCCIVHPAAACADSENWLNYATPIRDSHCARVYGVVNLCAPSNHPRSLGLLAVERCAEWLQQAIAQRQQDVLYIKALGTPQILYKQRPLCLSQRQIEILCILALFPQGIHLDALHAALYGDHPVSSNTLKAELSQLRHLLDNQILSRPYRLNCQLECDFLLAEQALDQHLAHDVFGIYSGSFLAKTESPLLALWRECLDARISRLIYQFNDCDQLLKLLSRVPERIDAIERLLQLLPAGAAIRPKLEQLLK